MEKSATVNVNVDERRAAAVVRGVIEAAKEALGDGMLPNVEILVNVNVAASPAPDEQGGSTT